MKKIKQYTFIVFSIYFALFPTVSVFAQSISTSTSVDNIIVVEEESVDIEHIAIENLVEPVPTSTETSIITDVEVEEDVVVQSEESSIFTTTTVSDIKPEQAILMPLEEVSGANSLDFIVEEEEAKELTKEESFFDKVVDFVTEEIIEPVKSLFVEEEKVEKLNEDLEFHVVDSVRDVAYKENGDQIWHIYQTPRPVQIDEKNGETFLRSKDWSLFQDADKSRFQSVEKYVGYQYDTPTSEEGYSVAISAGNLEKVDSVDENSYIKKPVSGTVSYTKENNTSISTIKNMYPNVDVLFHDKAFSRERKIIIQSEPEDISLKDKLLFWEEYEFPKGSDVLVGEDRIKGTQILQNNENVRIVFPDQSELRITGAIMFDSQEDTSMYGELSHIGLDQIVEVDYELRKMRIGLEVPGSYLTAKERVYPVIIDPVYYPCKENYSGRYYLDCNQFDFYLRAVNGGAQNPSAEEEFEGRLYTGRLVNGVNDYTRHLIVAAAADYMNLPGDVDNAQLKMYYHNFGEGSDQVVNLEAKRVTKAWPPYNISSLSYPYFREHLEKENESIDTFDSSETQRWVSFDITNSVRQWKGGEINWGVLLEPSEEWSSGNTPPASWKDRLLVFNAQEEAGDYAPYIRVLLTETNIDLIPSTRDVSDDAITVGDAVRLDVRILNQGSDDSGASSVGYYLSRDTQWDQLDYLIASDSVDALSSQGYNDEYTNITFSENFLAADSTYNGPGTYYILFRADKAGVVGESNEENNVVYEEVTISEPILDPYEPNDSSGSAEYLGSSTSYTRNNSYLTEADEDWYRFIYDGKNYYIKVRGYRDTEIGTYHLSFSRSGSVVTIQTSGPTNGEPDTYMHLYDSDLVEIAQNDDYNEDDILFSRIVNFNLQDLPDLILEDQSVEDVSLIVGDVPTASVRIRNSGGDINNLFTLQYYLSTDTVVDDNDFPLNSRNISSLASGEYIDVSNPLPLPESLDYLGSNYILFQIDDNENIIELNEDNNTAYIEVDINQVPSRCTIVSPNITASNQNLSLNLDWGCSDPDGSIVDYFVEISTDQYFSGTDFYSEWIGNNNSVFGVSNLSYGTRYYWRVKARDNDGAEGYFPSSQWYFTTKSPQSGSGSSNPTHTTADNDGDGIVELEEGLGGTTEGIVDVNPTDDSQSQENSNGEMTPVADPVDARTGSFELTQTDLQLSGRGESIDLTRYYNSKTIKNARFGLGWKYSYNQYYYKDPTSGKVVVYKGGTVANIFEMVDGKYVSAGQTDKLYNDATETFLILEKLSGMKYYYSLKLTDNMGLLERIEDTNANATIFNYTEKRNVDMLTQVVDSSGREITFTYGEITDDKRWDKVTKVTYNSGDPNNSATIDYIYETLDSEIPVLKEVRKTIITDGVTTIKTDSFTYAKYVDTDVYRLYTYTDARGTILYNTYDAEGRTTVQHEYNSDKDQVGEKRLVWTLAYLGEDPAVTGDSYCTLVKNYSDEVNFTLEKYCYSDKHLKVAQFDTDGNTITQTRNAEGMVISKTDQNNKTTGYTYDTDRRVVSTILPNTENWRTKITYTYGAFNRIQEKREQVYEIIDGVVQAELYDEKVTSYTIDPTDGNILSVIDPMGNTESYTYDQYGNILTHTDKNSNIITYTYDVNGNYRLTESKTVTDADNQQETITKTYTYDVFGNRETYTDPMGEVYTYTYDNQNNILTETNPLGGIKTYEYDIEGHRTARVNENNQRTEFVYATDISASLLETKQIGLTQADIVTSKDYDNLGRLVTETDANGNEISYVYDDNGRISQKITPVLTIDYIYDAKGNLKEETDIEGRKKVYIYDARNQIMEERAYSTAIDFVSIQYVYDGFGNQIRVIDPNGNRTVFEYNANNQLVEEENEVGHHIEYVYDAIGNRVGEKQDRCLMDVGLCNSDGNTITYDYDEAGRRIRIRYADDTESIFTYNARGDLTNMIDRQSADGLNNTHTVSYTYDKLGRKLTETDAYGNSISYTYDALGNVLTVTDKESRVTTYIYDEFNRLISEEDNGGNITRYTYDAQGNQTGITYADNTTVDYIYDTGHRKTDTIDAYNNTSTLVYDGHGNITSRIDKKGNSTSFVYNKLDQLTSETNVQGTQTIYTYDNNGNRLSENVDGHVTSFLYDDLNRVTQVTSLGNKTEHYTYDAEGNIITKVDGENSTITYVYDVLGQIVSKTFSDETQSTYIYDNWGNNTQSVTLELTTNYTYDDLNRQTQEVQRFSDLPENSKIITRTYNTDSSPASLTDASGKTITYTYNNRGFLQTVNYLGQPLATYGYTSFGKPASLTYANNYTTNYVYDDLQRLETQTIVNPQAETVWSHDYTYDAEHNRTRVVENNTRIIDYTYDTLDQLKTVDYTIIGAGVDQTYTYDKWGNRTTYVNNTDTTNYTYALNTNELASYTVNNTLAVSNVYDGNGSLTQEVYTRGGDPLKTVDYVWDAENRLSQISYTDNSRPNFLPSASQNTVSFAYDDYGNRIKKSVNNEASYYINDGLRVLNELDSAGVVSKTNIYGIEMIAEIDAEDEITYIHTDVLGSTVLLTDESSEIVGMYEYDAFGGTIGYEGTQTTNYLFTNQEQDFESELYYYNARYYNPKTGRFISRDSYMGRDGDVLSRNRYVYVKNNPLKYVDPTGMIGEDFNLANYSYGFDYGYGSDSTSMNSTPRYINSDMYDSGYDVLLDSFPITGDISEAYGAITGRYLFSGDEFTELDAMLFLMGGELPFVPTRSLRGSVVRGLDVDINDFRRVDPNIKLLNTRRGNLLSKVQHQKLRSIIERNYRSSAKYGDGGTADAIRHTKITGELIGGSNHIQKGQDSVNALRKFLGRENISVSDRSIAQELLNDLLNALN
ncbi:MAG: hypothetical protein HOE80_03785 [Candidatus Magasanikbacteria bacterium]|nr:hypothetical protein [Candidatus Magasanikbacteria bacterium]